MGADELTLQAIIKSLISRGIPDAELEKGLNTAGLLAKKKEIMVNGKPEYKIYWVRPENEEKEKQQAQREVKKDTQVNAPKEKKQEVEDYEKPQKPEKDEDDDDFPEEAKAHINAAHSAKPGKKPIAVVLHDKDTKTHASVGGELSRHDIKAAHINPQELKHHTGKAIEHAASGQKHVVYDASSQKPEEHRKAVQKLKEHGYDVHEIGRKK